MQIFAARRLRGQEGTRSRNILIVMVVLVAIRMCIRATFGSGQAYRSAVVLVGIAAEVSAPVLTRMLIARKKADGRADVNGAEEQIQSLKLN